MELFGIPTPVLFGQLLLGLINGAFYAILSLGLAVIFGLLNIINFTHGAQYMMGAFTAWMLLNWAGLGYWWALILAPLLVGASGILIERLLLKRLAGLEVPTLVVAQYDPYVWKNADYASEQRRRSRVVLDCTRAADLGALDLFEATPNPYLLLAPDSLTFTIVGLNEAYGQGSTSCFPAR